MVDNKPESLGKAPVKIHFPLVSDRGSDVAAAMTANIKLGVIGAGQMAGSMVKGWLSKGVLKPTQVLASVPVQDSALLEPLTSLGCAGTNDNLEVANWAEVVLLGVKPNVISRVGAQLGGAGKGQLLLSIAAGLNTESLAESFGPKWKVVRAMPNTAVRVGEGAAVFCLGQGAGADEGAKVNELFSSLGLCRQVEESQLDAVTGVSGSGPAYMYLILEAMADEGVRQGLGRNLAYSLAAQTMVGAGRMVLETGLHPGQLKDEVTSPKGSTIAAVRALEQGGLRAAMMDAVAAAVQRCGEMK